MNAPIFQSLFSNSFALWASLLATPLLVQELVSRPSEPALPAHGPAARVVFPEQAPALAPLVRPEVVELAICLDTSGSMDNLIDAARQKIWAIVNDFALAEPQPLLRVAVLSFGNDGDQAERGWVRIAQPLTGDLDLVSQRLFELKTNGGSEYVARVVHVAQHELAWTQAPGALKIVIVAGNEGADQDPEITGERAAADAIAAGIQVNTLYCGGEGDGQAPGWQAVARRADGFYAAIDPTQLELIASPFDARLSELSGELNLTYVAFDAAGELASANQIAQDANASSLGIANSATRAQSKGGKLYRTDWDLVGAYQEGRVKLDELDASALPGSLKESSSEELAAHLEGCAAKRSELQGTIQQLSQQRAEWIEAERARQQAGDVQGFGGTLLRGIRAQAEKKGFVFEAPRVGAEGGSEPKPEPGTLPGSVPAGECAPAATPVSEGAPAGAAQSLGFPRQTASRPGSVLSASAPRGSNGN